MFERNKQLVLRLCSMGAIPAISIIHVMLNVYRENTQHIKILLDDMIPFWPGFSIPYLYWFIYVSIGLSYFAFKDNNSYFRLLGSVIFGMSICFVIFYFYPTMILRPRVIGNGFLEKSVKFIYSIDNPYNCFPSIHVLNSMLVTMFFCYYNKSFSVRLWSVISCVSIILSTLFIKQHYVLDAISGIVVSAIVFAIFINENLWNVLQVKKLARLFSTDGVEELRTYFKIYLK